MNQRSAFLREIRRKWKPRKREAHKGDFGRLLILAGSRGMTGAAHLAAMAALRTGAGLVTLGVPERVYPVLARREAEVMVRPFASTAAGTFALGAARPVLEFLKNQDVFAIGPGLSQNPGTQKFVKKIIRETQVPVVIDADGLNALKGETKILKACRGRAVLTPHPGEFQRVFEKTPGDSGALRKKVASEIAKKFGVILVLKGHRSVVAAPSGEVFVNFTGNPGMATAGTGDVLTGMIAALIGQGFSLWDAARFGVYLHGFAGDLAVKKTGEASLVAGDILDFLPRAIRSIRKI